MRAHLPRSVRVFTLLGLVGAALASTSATAVAQHPSLHGSYSGYNPPIYYPSGVYTGYAGSSYYLSKHFPALPVVPGYYGANPTMYSTGPIHVGQPVVSSSVPAAEPLAVPSPTVQNTSFRLRRSAR